MQVQGGLGILDDAKNKGMLRRSLLWHRRLHMPSLDRIIFPSVSTSVPSWSWIVLSEAQSLDGEQYPGGIDYFIPNFAGNEREDIQSLWSSCSRHDASNAPTANGWQYNIIVEGAILDANVCNIIYDDAAEERK